MQSETYFLCVLCLLFTLSLIFICFWGSYVDLSHVFTDVLYLTYLPSVSLMNHNPFLFAAPFWLLLLFMPLYSLTFAIWFFLLFNKTSFLLCTVWLCATHQYPYFYRLSKSITQDHAQSPSLKSFTSTKSEKSFTQSWVKLKLVSPL